MAKRSDAELIKLILPEPGDDMPNLNEAWHEFIIRCQSIITQVFYQICQQRKYQYQPSPDDIYQILEKTILQLYHDNFQIIRSINLTADFRLEKIIGPIAISFIIDLLTQASPNNKQSSSLSAPDETKKS